MPWATIAPSLLTCLDQPLVAMLFHVSAAI